MGNIQSLVGHVFKSAWTPLLCTIRRIPSDIVAKNLARSSVSKRCTEWHLLCRLLGPTEGPIHNYDCSYLLVNLKMLKLIGRI
jgi:hypothetical protein